MLHLLIQWVIAAAAFLIAAKIVPGFHVKSWGSAFVAALVLGGLNLLVKPLLVFLTLPLTILTLGLFLLVVNAIVVSLAGFIVKGVEIKGFWAAFFAAIVISIFSTLANRLVDDDPPTAETRPVGETL